MTVPVDDDPPDTLGAGDDTPPPPDDRDVLEGEGPEGDAAGDDGAARESEVDEQLAASYERNDLGNGDRLRLRFGRELLYMIGDDWFCWDGRRWKYDHKGRAATVFGQRTARAVVEEAKALDGLWRVFEAKKWPEGRPKRPGKEPPLDETERHALWQERRELWNEYSQAKKEHDARISKHVGWSITSGNAPKVAAMLSMAQPHLLTEARQFDDRPYLFNVAGGTLDLGLLRGSSSARIEPRAFAHADRLTLMSGVAFDAQAACPNWLAFLDRILPSLAVQEWLQRFVGYMLTGDVSAQIMLIAWGSGANGKTALFTVLQRLFGEYAVTADVRTFMEDAHQRSASSATPDLARLRGARLVVASESSQNDRLAEGTVKQITGGDHIIARPMFGGIIEFPPAFKLCMLTNHKPRVRGQDEGIWRRVVLMPFGVTIPVEERRPFEELVAELVAEGPGILNWAIEGLRAFYRDGLKLPVELSDATAEYRRDSDPVGQFAETCTVMEPGCEERAQDVFALYRLWCEASGERAWSQKAFFVRYAEVEGVRKRVSGVTFYGGRKLMTAESLGLKDAKASGPDRTQGGYDGDEPV